MINKREIGTKYENTVAEYLKNKGYIILDKNFRNGRYSEIDIIADDRGTIVFVEVKYRSSDITGHPLESVDVNKQRRISRAALRYIYDKGLDENHSYRFDVIGVLDKDIKHIKNAFEFIV
ncbi:MAG: YraN family protein [Wujia sp.]